LGPWGHGLVNALVGVGMLVVIPLGLRLIEGPGRRGWVWLACAIPAAGSVWLPRGWPAVLLALPYLLVTGALLIGVPARLTAGGRPSPRTVAVATALAAPFVASTSLLAERAGYRLFGFDLDVLTLTVAHFHYAGFAAALIAGLVCGLPAGGRPGALAALSVPAGTAVVFVGYFVGDWLELVGAVVLTGGMWLVGWLTWRQARPLGAERMTRLLLAASALVLAATMVLALDWALGRVAGLPHLSLAWMAATHGLANALGFALCGLLGWSRLVHSGAPVVTQSEEPVGPAWS
jgi:hypothetical protein